MKPLIIANWKMNPSNSKDAFDLVVNIKQGIKGLDVDVVVCPPFVYISEVMRASSITLGVGGQDCFWEQEGPYTGEVSPLMIKNLGCGYVIVGHSERRKHMGETEERIQKKVKAALQAQLIPVVCIGENIKKEMQRIVNVCDEKDMLRIVCAYEPEWAISTQKDSKPETPDHARSVLKEMKKMIGEKACVIYGGSVNSKDIKGFLDAGFQGVLVGAASLDSEEFIALVKQANI